MPEILKNNNDNISLFNLFDRDTILHLRLPFSFFLLPVFWFGLSQAESIHWTNTIVVFIALHIFIYPGSNVYNSYMDKDTGSIGGLKAPPPVTKRLYYASILFDTAGLALCCIANWRFAAIMSVYVIFSKAYSWTGIRLKKNALASWGAVTVFQGGYTFLMAHMAAVDQPDISWFTPKNIECMLFASVIIGGSYPLTQIYQHKEDSERGDYTLSYRLGVIGTFLFTAVSFTVAAGILMHYMTTYYTLSQFLIFNVCLAPVIIYFLRWFMAAYKNKDLADFEHAMMMTKISACCMILCFSVIMYLNHK